MVETVAPTRSRRLPFWAILFALVVCVLGGVFVLLWIKLPTWAPEWVVEHSPWVDPIVRAVEAERNQVDYALDVLNAMGPSVIPTMGDYLERGRPDVRWFAAHFLRCNDHPAAFEALLPYIDDRDPSVIEEVLSMLGLENCRSVLESNRGRIVEILIRHLSHPNASVRGLGAKVLGLLKDPRSAEPLLALLREWEPANEEDKKWVAEVVDALGEIRDVRAIKPLVSLLGRDEIRGGEVVDALLKLPHEAVTSAVLPFPSGDSVQLWSYFSLVAQLDDPRAVAALAVIMREELPAGWRPLNQTTRGEIAAGSLVHARHSDGVPLLVAAFADPLVHVRLYAVSGVLGTYGRKVDARLLPPLRAALADPQPIVRSLAAFACAFVRLEGVEPTLFAMLADPNAEMRAQAAIGLANTWGPDESIPRLAELLSDAEAKVRRSAVMALRRIAKPAAVDALLAAAPGADAQLQLRIASAFAEQGFTKDPRIFPWLLRLLADGSPFYHRQAMRALDRLILDEYQLRQIEAINAKWVEVEPQRQGNVDRP